MKNPAKSSPGKVGTAPQVKGIRETALYAEDLAGAEKFYSDVLGLPKISAIPGRMVVFRCAQDILLIFNPKATSIKPIPMGGGIIPLHGTLGAGHTAFLVSAPKLATWRKRFHKMEVQIESEVKWPNGARSIYFRDPAGNSLELVTPKLWT
jgi:catechol 2,3-dioxygenase-like lactoylglutathione lyase family enzyme